MTYVRSVQTEGDRTERMVFHATDDRNGLGWYRWEDGAIRTVVRTGETLLPGDSEPVTAMFEGDASGVYLATIPPDSLELLRK